MPLNSMLPSQGGYQNPLNASLQGFGVQVIRLKEEGEDDSNACRV